MKFKFPHILPFIMVGLFACTNDEFTIDSGTADFSKYIAVGNSLTAGYTNGGLYREAQLNSYPNILSMQMGTSFSQPLMPEGNGSGYIYLTSYISGIPGFNIANSDPNAFNKVTGDFQNLGIPGLRVKDIDNPVFGHKENNSYFYRLVESGKESNFTYLDLLENSNHTFFTCWLGNNDILGYATDGGFAGIEGEGEFNDSGLTPVIEFQYKYGLLMDRLKENNAKGVLLTIPDLSLIPFFNLVSNDDFPTINEEWLKLLQEIYADYNEAIDSYNAEIEADETLSEIEKVALLRSNIEFSTSGPNAFVIEDKDLPGEGILDKDGKPVPKIRHLLEGEKITLNGVLELTDFTKLAGIQSPLDDKFVLTNNEIKHIIDYKEDYNEIIRGYKDQSNITVIEVDNILLPFVDGKTIDGVKVNTQFIEGGLFSLDGVHLTQRGYAIVSNEIIKTINQTFSSNVSQVDISMYSGVDLP